MSRSPLAYPLNRAADMDVGGAADLQTDVMRFMAILALCLVAIFALVQSIPLTPVEPQPAEQAAEPTAPPAEGSVAAPRPNPQPAPRTAPLTRPARAAVQPVENPVVLTRPQQVAEPITTTAAPADSIAPPPIEDEGFTLRFASDAALMRSVAAHRVGVYAIDAGRTRRMTVSESRISFWDASTPNAFHEMHAATVPVAVVDALARSGAAPGPVQWGVTLPARMTAQLETLMQEHRGGDLVIGAGGGITWEASR